MTTNMACDPLSCSLLVCISESLHSLFLLHAQAQACNEIYTKISASFEIDALPLVLILWIAVIVYSNYFLNEVFDWKMLLILFSALKVWTF